MLTGVALETAKVDWISLLVIVEEAIVEDVAVKDVAVNDVAVEDAVEDEPDDVLFATRYGAVYSLTKLSDLPTKNKPFCTASEMAMVLVLYTIAGGPVLLYVLKLWSQEIV